MFKPATRDKDEKDVLTQLEIAYLQRIEKSSATLHVSEINSTFQSLYNIFQFMQNKINNQENNTPKILYYLYKINRKTNEGFLILETDNLNLIKKNLNCELNNSTEEEIVYYYKKYIPICDLLKSKIDLFIKNYNSIMIEYERKKDNIRYFLELNDLNREIYSLLKEALKNEF